MSLNNIKLSPYLVSALYPKSLLGESNDSAAQVITTVPEKKIEEAIKSAPEKTTPATAGLKFLGNNQKKVSIIVNYNDTVHLPDAQLDFLTTLLTACKLSLNDVAIINMNNYKEASYDIILTNFESKIVLLFGLTAQQFGFPFETPQYQVQQFVGKTILHAPALHNLENDKTAKGKLWNSLKRIFEI